MATKEITYNLQRVATLGVNERTGWALELNVVAWNGGAPKWDIRSWSSDHKKMSKGVTFTTAEGEALFKALKNEYQKGGKSKK